MNNLVTVSILSVLLASCAPAAPSATVTIDMFATDPGFAPDPVTVSKGQQVCWKNSDEEARWPASNIHPTHEIFPDFDPKQPVRSGETWCFTFNKPGIWKYHDHLYPEFVGTVNVD